MLQSSSSGMTIRRLRLFLIYLWTTTSNLDNEFDPTLMDEKGRTPMLVASFIESGSVYVKILPSTKENLLGKDKDRNEFLDLAASAPGVVTQYVQKNTKRLREVGRDVTLKPYPAYCDAAEKSTSS